MYIEKDPRYKCYENESIAMKYINHFAINEDDQFEIAAIKTIYKDTMPLELDQAIEAAENLTKLQIEQSSSDENFQNQLHILWAGDFTDLNFRRIKHCLDASIHRCGYESALPNSLFTHLHLNKVNCETKVIFLGWKIEI